MTAAVSSSSSSAPKQCYFCKKDVAVDVVLRCGRCMMAIYCNKACQTADWKGNHKSHCNLLAQVKQKAPAMQVQQLNENYVLVGNNLSEKSSFNLKGIAAFLSRHHSKK